VHCLSCGDVQREQRIYRVERVHGLSCGGVLPCGLQLVQRERVVCCWQLLHCRQRYECILRTLPWRSILPRWVWERQRQRDMRRGQFFGNWQWSQRAVHAVSCGGVLPGGLFVFEREWRVWSGQLLDSR
jgi:hypothetical protein